MTTYQLFGATSGPGSQAADPDNYTLAVEFYVTDPGCSLTEIRLWASGTVTSSDHAVRLYQVTGAGTGTLVGGSSKALPSPLVSGWNAVTLDAPIALTANQRYRAGVWFTTSNGYTATSNYWLTGGGGGGASGITSGPLVAPSNASATDSNQGSFNAGADGYPAGAFNETNYWVDVTIDDGTGGGTVEGALAGTTSAPSGALTGSVIDSGVLAGTTPPPSGALTAALTGSGALAGVTGAPFGGLAATVTVTGALAGVTAAPVGALIATAPIEGVLAGTTAAPSGALAGVVRVSALLAGTTPPPVGTLSTAARVGVMRPVFRRTAAMRAAARQLASMRKG